MGFPPGVPVLDTEQMFHPVVATWLERRFGAPTPAQAQAWPLIAAGKDVLCTAPTGSGKTLAAFLWALDRLVAEAIAAGGDLPDRTSVLYVSPLKALSNDVRSNLEEPLAELRALATELGYPAPGVRTAVRTGDTTARERRAAALHPPHVLVTTPESLFILLTSESGRRALRDVRTVIVDEIHAVAADKRGAHLALSLERLEALVAPAKLQRVGLSATVRPLEVAARLLAGGHALPEIVDVGQRRDLDLAVLVPEDELGAVCTNEQWGELYDRVAALAREHRSTLVFVNTRRLVERVTLHLGERLGAEAVAAHHGSLSRERRHRAERRLKEGDLRVVVATASLELGIDVGAVELTCLIGSPRSISTGLQRIGRSGHALRATPKGRLFPLTRDQLVECAALVRAARRAEIDAVRLRDAPLDVLAQQIVAASAAEDWDEDELFALVRRAAPYAELVRSDFDAVVDMLSEGIATSRGRVGRAAPSRRRQPPAARAARRAPGRADVGRRDPGQRQLRRRAGAGRHGHRQRRRGLRHRIDGGRHHPARQLVVAHPPRRARAGPRRGCGRRGADDPVLAGRGTGAHARAVAGGRDAARGDRGGGGARRGSGAGADGRVRARSPRRRAAARLRRGRRDGAGRRADADTGDRGAVLRRRGRHAAGHPRAVRRPHQPRLGHGAAQALLPVFRLRAAGGGDGRRHRAVAGAAAQLPARDRVLDAARRRRRGAAGPGGAPGADVRDALALERDALAGAAAQPRRQAGPPCPAADARAGSDRGGVSRRRPPARTTTAAGRSRSPTTRWCARRCATAWSRRWTPRACAPCSRGWRTAASPRRARAPRAVGVRARDPERQPVRVPRRRAAGRAAHARGRAPPRAARRGRRADRRPRSGGDRRGGRRGAARPARRRRAARSAARSRRAARGRSDRTRGWTDLFDALVESRRAARLEGDPVHWVAAERRSVAAAVWPARRFVPDVVEPPSRRAAPRRRRQRAGRDRARSRRPRSGRRRRSAIAARLGVRPSDVDAALARLEMEGAVLRGRFRIDASDDATQWCDRRLLARINRRMLDGLRREIEPVSAADCCASCSAGSTCARGASCTASPGWRA